MGIKSIFKPIGWLFAKFWWLLDGTRRAILNLLLLFVLIAVVAVGYLTWWATSFTWESYEFKEMATGLVVIPIWIPQSTFAIGCWLLLIALIDELIGVLRGHTPSYQRAVEERHAAGDFSSDI